MRAIDAALGDFCGSSVCGARRLLRVEQLAGDAAQERSRGARRQGRRIPVAWIANRIAHFGNPFPGRASACGPIGQLDSGPVEPATSAEPIRRPDPVACFRSCLSVSRGSRSGEIVAQASFASLSA